MFGLPGCESRSALPSPPGSGSSWWRPWYSSCSPRSAIRTISIVSRMRPSGCANERPCRPSTTCGPLAPRPRMKRSSERLGQRQRGHRRHRRRARADLHDAGAEQDPRRARRDEGERRHRVLAPRLGRPDGVHAEPLRLDGEARRGLEVAFRGPRPHCRCRLPSSWTQSTPSGRQQLPPSRRARGPLGWFRRRVPMASIRREAQIAALPETVWTALRDVGALHRRLAPGFATDTPSRRAPGSSRSGTAWSRAS